MGRGNSLILREGAYWPKERWRGEINALIEGPSTGFLNKTRP